MKLALAQAVRSHRERANLTQAALAERLSSSQSRVAKIEAGDPSVSLDLLVRAVLATGAKKVELARALLRGPSKPHRRPRTMATTVTA